MQKYFRSTNRRKWTVFNLLCFTLRFSMYGGCCVLFFFYVTAFVSFLFIFTFNSWHKHNTRAATQGCESFPRHQHSNRNEKKEIKKISSSFGFHRVYSSGEFLLFFEYIFHSLCSLHGFDLYSFFGDFIFHPSWQRMMARHCVALNVMCFLLFFYPKMYDNFLCFFYSVSFVFSHSFCYLILSFLSIVCGLHSFGIVEE